MGVLFVGGERIQRGRGIGGILKFAAKLFSPLKSLAQSAIKSESGKQAVKALKKQAVTSSIKIANDIASGGSVKNAVKSEFADVKEKTKRKAFDIGSQYLSSNLNNSESKPKKKKKNEKKNKKKLKKKIDILS